MRLLILLTAAVFAACRSGITTPARVYERHVPLHAAFDAPNQTNVSMVDDTFSWFRVAVPEHFRPVAAQFELRSVTERQIGREIYIEYRGPAGKLTIAHEVGAGTWVYVTITAASGHERQFGLHTIVEEQTRSACAFSELSKLGDRDAKIRALANLTREHAEGLLSERTASLRELYLLKRRERTARELTMTGSDLPLTPTLADLFQACKTGNHVICAYAAVVDHDYSIEDVAAFLKDSPDNIQRMITEHDRIR